MIPKGHPLAERKRLRMFDLDGQPFVIVRPDVEPAWALVCSRALVRAGVRVEITQETDTKIAMLGLVAAGAGLSLVSASMMRLARDGVVFREVTDLRARAPLVALSGTSPSARATALLRLATHA